MFLATMAVLIGLLAWALLRPGDPNPLAATAAPTTSATHSAPQPTPTATPSDEMPPAWLAWISGSLPSGFGADVHAAPTLGTTVIVAGDTRWMTSSHDADGGVVDKPSPPFEIPIDAFAVDPGAYAPFVPESSRSQVVDALRAGEAVLGTSSAQLRHLTVGGSLTFDQTTVPVGAIVPDPVAGWSEMLVSRTVGRTLGIVDDRYLLVDARWRDDRTAVRLGPGNVDPRGAGANRGTGRIAVHAHRLGREPSRRDERRLR